MDQRWRALSPTSSVLPPPLHSSSGTSFPIIAVAVIGILAIALLLVGYYIFVIKCCLNWHRIDLLRRFSLSRRDDPLMAGSPDAEPRGLDESVIRSIPTFRFRKGADNRDFRECAVCLNEFEEDEELRVIPNCTHVFHVDCIDVWLQSSANCPLCRSAISGGALTESSIGGDEDFVVIELVSANGSFPTSSDRGESEPPRPRMLEQRVVRKVGSKGDECIDTRGYKDEQFQIQPMRRSVSMDSADRKLFRDRELSSMEGCSSGRVKRSFFLFGHGSKGSRNGSVLPLYLDP